MFFAKQSTAAVFDNFTPAEIDSYFERFGESYWNDTENIVCVPVEDLNKYQRDKYNFFLNTIVDLYDYLILNFDLK